MSNEENNNESSGLDSIKNLYENNQRNIQIIGIAFILLAAGLYYYFNYYKPGVEADAADEYFIAERYYLQDSLDKALNGDGMSMGLLDIADEYGSTTSGNLASFYAGSAQLRKGKFQEALDLFENVSFDDEFMAAQVVILRGDCHSELGDYETAGEQYMKAANLRDNKLTTNIALKKAAQAFEASNNFDDAFDAWETLVNRHPKDIVLLNEAISRLEKCRQKTAN